jgi:Flp pilus assembly protein TadD
LDGKCADARKFLGVALGLQNKVIEAELVLREALKQNPNDSDLHVALCGVFVIQRRGPEAEAAAREALRLNPQNEHARKFLASKKSLP